MTFDLVQWRFMTKVLGWTIPESHAPQTAKSATQVSEAATTFDPDTADVPTLKTITGQVRDWADAIRDVGRDRASSGMNAQVWNAHVKTVRGTIADTAALRGKIADMLKTDDLDAATRAELEALQAQVSDALVEALDLEPAHGPNNHLKISRDGMGRRALYGKDPRGRGGTEKTKRATRFTSPEAFLQAYEAGLNSQTYTDEIAARTDRSDPDNPTVPPSKRYFKIEMPLKDIFGDNYLDAVEGQTYIGSGSQREKIAAAMRGGAPDDADALLGDGGAVGLANTDLSGGTVRIDFMYVDGAWELSTMFPQIGDGVTRDRERDMRYDRAADQWLRKDSRRGDNWHPYDPDTGQWITS